MSKKILYQDNARKALEKGMKIMVEAVAVTLGPRGRNVVLEKQYGSPQIVNDGVTIDQSLSIRGGVLDRALDRSSQVRAGAVFGHSYHGGSAGLLDVEDAHVEGVFILVFWFAVA